MDFPSRLMGVPLSGFNGSQNALQFLLEHWHIGLWWLVAGFAGTYLLDGMNLSAKF